MASGIFIGLTEDELLAIKAKAISLITAGVITTSYSDSGTSLGKQITMNAKDMLAESLYALSILDPQTYGQRRTVLRASFRRQDF